MTTYNTMNPVPSADARDRYDNSQVFDELMNGLAPSTPDRLGVLRQSWAGMELAFSELLANSGFELPAITYAAGVVIDRPSQLISYLGELYSVKANQTFPYTLDGTFATDAPNLVLRSDQALRTELAAAGGVNLVTGARRDVDNVAALRLMPGRYDGDQATLAGYYTAASRSGGGRLVWDAASSEADNGFTVFQVTGVPTGRWKRVVKGPLYLAQSGAIADYSGSTGTDNRVTVQAAMDVAAAFSGHLVVDGHYGLTFDTASTGLGFDIPSDFHLEYNAKGQFSALAHNDTIYQFHRIWGKNNVTITNANLDGRKDLNAAVTGEFGMGIDVRGGSNITINGAKTVNMWGDGYYQGLTTGTNQTAVNVVFNNHFADGCRRQGASIVSAAYLDYNNPIWQNISGTSPAAGIDLEPNGNASEFIGVRINNPKTNNCTTGVKIDFALLPGAATKYIDIVVTGHRDYGSSVAANVSRVNTSAGAGKILGGITFVNSFWERSGNMAFNSEDWDYQGPAVRIIRPTVIDPNRNAQASVMFGSPFVIFRASSSLLTYTMGNIQIEEPIIRLTSGAIPALFAFDNLVAGSAGDNTTIRNVSFRDPIELSGMASQLGTFFGQGNISDKHGVWEYPVAGTATITAGLTAPLAFPTASANFTLVSANHVAGSPDLIFRTKSTNVYSVVGPAAGAFVGAAGTTTQLRCTNNAGSYLRLRPLGSGKFLIVEKVGTWTEIV